MLFRSLGRGPVETYPDRRRGAPIGRWASSTADELASYVRPQECGGHADVRILELRDASGRGWRIELDPVDPGIGLRIDQAGAMRQGRIRPADQALRMRGRVGMARMGIQHRSTGPLHDCLGAGHQVCEHGRGVWTG